MKEKGITRIAVKDLHKIKSLTDWKRVDALSDEDIEKAVAEDPDTWIPTKEEWASARVVWPAGKEPIQVGIEKDIVKWFRKRGRGYQSRMNIVLREYIEAQKPPRKATTRTVASRKRAIAT
jgi:uncharacterized protein (DUF4415 family)